MKRDGYLAILQNILRWIDEGIHVIDKDGNTILYNENMAKIEGLNVDQVMNRNILEVFPSLNNETSTLLTSISTKDIVQNKTQTYLNLKGKHITTQNSSIPIIVKGEIVGALEVAKNITQIKELSEKIVQLQQELLKKEGKNKETNSTKSYTFDSIVGRNSDFINVITMARRSAKSSASVLIYGETGTGKEMIAQSIHYQSNRKEKPFIAQNCAALPQSLLEGILFGTTKGSFTGAIDRPGLFEQANGGTLLLDEINSMGIELQSKLLRVLQEGYVRRIGGLKDIPVDVRIIATTNEKPTEAIENGHLRKDLYYRLNVISLSIPPLRQRKEDIKLLSDYFIKKYNSILNKNIWMMSQEVKGHFERYHWPGNVRELENVIAGVMSLMEDENVILQEHFPSLTRELIFGDFGKKNKDSHVKDIEVGEKALPELIEDIEKDIITKALISEDYNITKAANALGIKRQTLQHKIKRYGL